MDDFNEAGGDVFDADDYVEDVEVQHWGASDEEEDVDIDELATRVERAADLIRLCSEKLRAAELRVEKVTRELADDESAEDDADEE